MLRHRPILLPLVCETSRSSWRLRVSSPAPPLKVQEFGRWLYLDSWVILFLEPLASSAFGIDYVSTRCRLKFQSLIEHAAFILEPVDKKWATSENSISKR